MRFFDLFKRKDDTEEWEQEQAVPENVPLNRERLDVHNSAQREQFIRNCCEQIREATAEVDKSEMEYRLVTDYLTDMEEIEQLPNEERADINACARKICALKNEQKNSKSLVGGMTDKQFESMERIEDEMPDGFLKMKKDEDYKVLVKQDLQKLEGEKAACMFRKRELMAVCANARGMAVIVVFAMAVVVIALLVFQLVFEMDSRMGYMAAAGAGALALTLIFLRYNNAAIAKRRAERSLNHIIALQNTVKIRYVNIMSVLEYAYTKYKVNNSDELNYLWEKYAREKEERQKLAETDEELAFHKQEMVMELRKLRIKIPDIWVHQAEALIDSKEMVEIRHNLIVQRQSLRKRIEYNEDNRNSAKEEINAIVKEYPRYAREILAIVSEYE